MATALTNAWPTLVDVARRLDPNGKIARMAEILNQYNEINEDIVWIEGNLPTGHKTSLRATIPTPTWRLINQGVVPVKSTSNQVTESCGMMEVYSEIDFSLAQLNGNTPEWRASEDDGVLEGMNQALAFALFYGDTSINPEKFVGFTPRYYTYSPSATQTSGPQYNVISATASQSTTTSNSLTSIWLIGWGPDTCFGIFPKGSKAGLTMEDLGKQTLLDSNTPQGRYEGYRTHFKWDCGLCVRDWRYVVRCCNIDVTSLLTASDSTDNSANILKYMSIMIDRIPPSGRSRLVFYMNQTVRSMLRVKYLNKSNTWLELSDWVQGRQLPRPSLLFQGIPCRRVDQLSLTEPRI